jgi:hypothetical protein
MLPVAITKSLIAGSANCIGLSQSVAAGAGALLNGGSVVAGIPGSGPFGAIPTQAVLDTQRRVVIVSGGNDSANTAHIYGKRGGGQPINEILALTNGGTAVSVLDYEIVTGVTPAAATASTITIGTNGTGSTDWIVPNSYLTPFSEAIATEVSGTVAYNIETTNTPWFATPTVGAGPSTPTPQPIVNEIGTAIAAGTLMALSSPFTGLRFTITSGAGTLSAQAQQAGIVN